MELVKVVQFTGSCSRNIEETRPNPLKYWLDVGEVRIYNDPRDADKILFISSRGWDDILCGAC